ncbi:MAG: aryl-sulfate sulfotransferase [Candidatus Sulfotelmatobacter sp.]
MRPPAPLQPCLVFAICTVCAFTFACGGGSFNDPPGFGATSVAATLNPLVAQYKMTTALGCSGQVMVQFGPDTSYGRNTAWYPATAASQTTTVLVAGMRAATTYHMQAVAQAQCPGSTNTFSSADLTFTTGPLPGPLAGSSSPQFPPISVTLPTPGLTPSPGVDLLSLTTDGPQSVGVDLQGHVIWYCPGNAEPVKPLPNGHFIIVRPLDLQEVDLACNVIRDVSYTQVNQSLQANLYDFTIPPPLGLTGGNPFHHDVLVLPNGHWIALCEIAKSFTDLPGYPGTTQVVGDALVDIDLNGNVVWAWSSFDHLDVNRYPYFGLPDWTHSNAVVYTADGNLLVSMRNQSWILKLDYANGTGSGNVLWKLGPEGDFTLLGGDPSDWFYAQHYPNILSVNGSQTTMAVYDDGNFRILSNGLPCGPPIPPSPNCYTRATIFQIDESTNVASLEWQYLPGFFSWWGGSIGVLSNGDVEFDSSAPSDFGGSIIIEVSQTDSPQVVWQMNIGGGLGIGAYRGFRLPSLYPGVAWQQ